jgi:hypothetical protein
MDWGDLARNGGLEFSACCEKIKRLALLRLLFRLSGQPKTDDSRR